MSNSQPSLTNLESIMKAAEAESALMTDSQPKPDTSSSFNETPKDSESIAQIIESVPKSDKEASLPTIPGNVQKPTGLPNLAEEVKAALNNTNINTMLNRMSNNPEEVSKMMQQSMSQMNPNMMEEARKLAMSGQGDRVMQEMRRRGLDPNVMRSQLLEQQKAMRGTSSKIADELKRAVLITASRVLKMRNIPGQNVQDAAFNIIKSGEPVELSCSRLALGPLAGKSIKVWCDPNRKGKNTRLSKIVGFPIAGEGLFVMEEGDLTEKDFVAAEHLIN